MKDYFEFRRNRCDAFTKADGAPCMGYKQGTGGYCVAHINPARRGTRNDYEVILAITDFGVRKDLYDQIFPVSGSGIVWDVLHQRRSATPSLPKTACTDGRTDGYRRA